MTAGAITRRTALALLSSVPVASRAAVQAPAAVPRRLVCDGSREFLRDTDGTVLAWTHGGLGFRGVSLGLGHHAHRRVGRCPRRGFWSTVSDGALGINPGLPVSKPSYPPSVSPITIPCSVISNVRRSLL